MKLKDSGRVTLLFSVVPPVLTVQQWWMKWCAERRMRKGVARAFLASRPLTLWPSKSVCTFLWFMHSTLFVVHALSPMSTVLCLTGVSKMDTGKVLCAGSSQKPRWFFEWRWFQDRSPCLQSHQCSSRLEVQDPRRWSRETVKGGAGSTMPFCVGRRWHQSLLENHASKDASAPMPSVGWCDVFVAVLNSIAF